MGILNFPPKKRKELCALLFFVTSRLQGWQMRPERKRNSKKEPESVCGVEDADFLVNK